MPKSCSENDLSGGKIRSTSGVGLGAAEVLLEQPGKRIVGRRVGLGILEVDGSGLYVPGNQILCLSL